MIPRTASTWFALEIAHSTIWYHLESIAINVGVCTKTTDRSRAFAIAGHVVDHGISTCLFTKEYTTRSTFECLVNMTTQQNGYAWDFDRALGLTDFPTLHARMQTGMMTTENMLYVFDRLVSLGNESWVPRDYDPRVIWYARAMMVGVGKCVLQKRLVDYTLWFRIKEQMGYLGIAKTMLAIARTDKEHTAATREIRTILGTIESLWKIHRPGWDAGLHDMDDAVERTRRLQKHVEYLKNGKSSIFNDAKKKKTKQEKKRKHTNTHAYGTSK